MTKKTLISLALASVFSVSVSANDVSYNNVTFGWADGSFDVGTTDIDFDGFSGGFSFDFSDNWYAKLDHLSTSGQDQVATVVQTVFGPVNVNGDFEIDFDLTTFNFGYHTKVSDSTDFIAELGYAKVESAASITGSVDSADDSGANLVLGFRGMATDSFEWGVNVQHLALDDSSTLFNLECRYHFTDSFSLGLKGSFESDVTFYSLNARFDF